MNYKGLEKYTVLRLIKDYLKEDLTYNSGRIFGSMCTSPHSFAKKIFIKAIEKNLGDAGLFPGTMKLEQEAIRMIGSLLSKQDASGYIVSGGTEANLMAMWAARNLAKKDRPEVIAPKSAHFSFDKAADLLGLKLVKIELDENFQVNTKAVKEAINRNTIAIVGMAGSTELGVVDPISELSEIALDNGIYLHIDASFGGFVLPFLRDIGYNIPEFDFNLKGVCSITIDSHKMGLAPIPAGGILFRDSESIKSVSIRVPYLSGGEITQGTILGTRSGASAVAVWALLKHMGREGYQKVVKRCMDLTNMIVRRVKKSKKVYLIINPIMNIVGLASHSLEPKQLADGLRRRGWAVSFTPTHIRLVIMPHIKKKHIIRFLSDLEELA
ncbi:MAG: tyrosine decarboxylase MfnA [archaeon]|nr:tyrosine decarboxylase MfnA [archaeon]MCP8314087.1 tyrosine decarboxylase MfnA [archaeon]MCP8318103.1 tyrosine decarboxylase MfnA [archaeon]